MHFRPHMYLALDISEHYTNRSLPLSRNKFAKVTKADGNKKYLKLVDFVKTMIT